MRTLHGCGLAVSCVVRLAAAAALLLVGCYCLRSGIAGDPPAAAQKPDDPHTALLATLQQHQPIRMLHRWSSQQGGTLVPRGTTDAYLAMRHSGLRIVTQTGIESLWLGTAALLLEPIGRGGFVRRAGPEAWNAYEEPFAEARRTLSRSWDVRLQREAFTLYLAFEGAGAPEGAPLALRVACTDAPAFWADASFLGPARLRHSADGAHFESGDGTRALLRIRPQDGALLDLRWEGWSAQPAPAGWEAARWEALFQTHLTPGTPIALTSQELERPDLGLCALLTDALRARPEAFRTDALMVELGTQALAAFARHHGPDALPTELPPQERSRRLAEARATVQRFTERAVLAAGFSSAHGRALAGLLTDTWDAFCR